MTEIVLTWIIGHVLIGLFVALLAARDQGYFNWSDLPLFGLIVIMWPVVLILLFYDILRTSDY